MKRGHSVGDIPSTADRDKPFTQVKGKSQRSKESRLTTDVNSQLMNTVENTADHASSQTAANVCLQSVVEVQKKEIDKLNNVINALSSKVSFLLTFLGIDDQSGSTSVSDAVPPSDSDNSTVTATLSSGSDSARPMYSAVLKNGTPAPSTFVASVKETPVYQAVVSTVYNELSERTSRSKNLVISGLPVTSDPNLTDRELFVNMCESEFGITPTVVSYRHLGRVNVSNSGKVRPLLVVLSSAAEAANYLSLAKQLRQSSNDYTSKCVFINANMTKSEAKAAYEARVRRRQIREAKIAEQNNTNTLQGTLASSSLTVLAQPAAIPNTNVNAPVFHSANSTESDPSASTTSLSH